MTLKSINPATGALVAEYEEMSAEETSAAVDAAHRAFLGWRGLSFDERAKPMRRAGQILRERARDYGRLMAEEMGKTFDEGRAEVEKCAAHCEWFADHAETYLAREPVDIGGQEAFVTFNPIGVVLAVMPWNFPFWQVFRFIAPGLMAGNAGVLKHASNVPGCAKAIEDVMREADCFRPGK